MSDNKHYLFGNMHGLSNSKDEWLTDPEIIRALGEFDLDPCAPIVRPWETAKNHFTIEDDGLARAWEGRVWMNPPYGTQTNKWMKKLAEHNDGIALIFARTETNTFFKWVWTYASGIMFLKGRLKFCHVDGTPANNCAGAPSCLIAYGENNAKILELSAMNGKYIKLR